MSSTEKLDSAVKGAIARLNELELRSWASDIEEYKSVARLLVGFGSPMRALDASLQRLRRANEIVCERRNWRIA